MDKSMWDSPEMLQKIADHIGRGTVEYPGILCIQGRAGYYVFGYANGVLGWDAYTTHDAAWIGGEPVCSGQQPELTDFRSQLAYVKSICARKELKCQSPYKSVKH